MLQILFALPIFNPILHSDPLTGFKRHRQRIGNNTAKTILPQEDGTEIFWGVTKITEAEILPKYWIGDPDRGWARETGEQDVC